MTTLLIVVHTIVCLFLICIVLLQHGKGADIGASFGGSSQSLFGTEGPMPLLNKITTLAAIVFMGTSITLAYLSAHKTSGSVMSEVKVQEQQAPAPPVQQTPITIPMPATQPAAKEVPKEAPEQPVKK
jgi:preprotein translocase subunit SecG